MKTTPENNPFVIPQLFKVKPDFRARYILNLPD
jgi:hypothetical protein